MSFASMYNEILGVPGMNLGLAKSKINEAFELIQDENVWSFQCQTGGWLSPGILSGNVSGFLSPGTISVQPFTNQITGDAVATAAWYGASNPSITSYQIRIPYYALYSIVGINGNGTIAYATLFTAGSSQVPGTYIYPILDNSGPGTGGSVSITVASDGTVSLPPTTLTAGIGYISPYIAFSEGGIPASFTVTQIAVLTLDRLWTDPPAVNANYLAYQAYFAAPAGFRRFWDSRDTTNNQEMNFWRYQQTDLARIDPQRTDFAQPEYIVYYQMDTRANSATFGCQLFELWQGPLQMLPYLNQWQVYWPPLVNPNDTLPFPITEQLVKFRTYEVIALWSESQKGTDMERGQGANWQFLSIAYRKQYDDLLKKIRIKDKNIVDLYFQKMRRTPGNIDGFVSVNGQMGVGF